MDATAFRHDAVLYEGLDGFVDAVLPFVADGMVADEAVLVIAPGDRVRALREALGDDVADVRLADMTVLGRNPARIIPAWQDFVDESVAGGRTFRGVGEPVWAGRSADELDECHGHEALLNHAFDGGPLAWQLLCPYDAAALDPSVLDAAGRTHRHVVIGDDRRPSDAYAAIDLAVPFGRPLPPPSPAAVILEVDLQTLGDLRARVTAEASLAGLDHGATSGLVLAANEVATNCIRHGDGSGTVALWATDGWFCVEARGGGLVSDPLVGRVLPSVERPGGRGLWLANQVCDLVRIHSTAAATSVRLQMRLP